MRLSGWCSPACSPRAHRTCQERLDKELLDGCRCEAHGGHTMTTREEDE